jgi:hypothetical protein
VLATVTSLGTGMFLLRPRRSTPGAAGVDDLGATRHLLRGPLLPLVRVRIAASVVGGIALPSVVLAFLPAPGAVGWATTLLVVVALVAFVIGELVDRRLFFLASVAPRRYGDIR